MFFSLSYVIFNINIVIYTYSGIYQHYLFLHIYVYMCKHSYITYTLSSPSQPDLSITKVSLIITHARNPKTGKETIYLEMLQLV